MLNRSKFALIAVLFAAPLVASSVVFGQTSPEMTTTTNTTQTTETEDAPETPVQKTEREARIKTLKEQQKVKLSVTEKKKIQDKCQAAQGKVSSVSGRVKGVETSRTKVHANLLARMETLVEKLKTKNLDTIQLETSITELKAKITTFETDLTTYKQSISDLRALDCKTDPEGFKAALQTARTNLETVRSDAKAVHSYLNETIKPLLKTIRAQVEGGTTTETTQGGDL